MAYHRAQSSKYMAGIFLILVSGIALGFAWYVQNIWNMAPCGLCLLERWPYRMLLFIGILVCFMSERLSRWLLLLAGLVLFGGMILSFVHIGVEQKWWDSPLPECRSVLTASTNLSEQFTNMPDRPHKPCDAPTYLFDWLPLSLTMLNGIYSLILFGVVLKLLGSNRSSRKFLS